MSKKEIKELLGKFLRKKYSTYDNLEIKDFKHITEGWETLVYSFNQVFNKMVELEKGTLKWDSISNIIAEIIDCESCSIFVYDRRKLQLVGTTGIQIKNNFLLLKIHYTILHQNRPYLRRHQLNNIIHCVLYFHC